MHVCEAGEITPCGYAAISSPQFRGLAGRHAQRAELANRPADGPAGAVLSLAGDGHVVETHTGLSTVLVMPPRLTNVLAAMSVAGSRDEYQAAEGRLGIRLDHLPGVRSDPAFEADATGLMPSEVREWLARLPVRPDKEATVAWGADRIGARMTFRAFASNVDDLWYPAMDDVIVLLNSREALDVLILDHEERITFSHVDA